MLVRELDLTVGRADNVTDNIGAIAAPFKTGPVEEATLISSQGQLIDVFGKPQASDNHYESWMTASEFLTYGGALSVVRIDGTNLNNANAGVSIASTTVKIKNYDDYENNYSTASDWFYASRTPGELATNLKVCFIDNAADQTVGIATTALTGGAQDIQVGYGVTVQITDLVVPGAGTTSTFTGMLKGIVTGVTTVTNSAIGNSKIDVRIVSRVSSAATDSGTVYNIDYEVQ